ncbi:MAG: hypothetical protein BYD32DRAFT_272760 [Podila humilis]|nr:MAG: hypothetical protein BYD32DRAFT_272760 [Podila humilis]
MALISLSLSLRLLLSLFSPFILLLAAYSPSCLVFHDEHPESLLLSWQKIIIVIGWLTRRYRQRVNLCGVKFCYGDLPSSHPRITPLFFFAVHPSETMSAVQNCSETFFIKSMLDVCLSKMGCTHGALLAGGMVYSSTKQNVTKNHNIRGSFVFYGADAYNQYLKKDNAVIRPDKVGQVNSGRKKQEEHTRYL